MAVMTYDVKVKYVKLEKNDTDKMTEEFFFFFGVGWGGGWSPPHGGYIIVNLLLFWSL